MRKQAGFLATIIVAFGMTGALHAQEKSSKFAHVSFPDEVKAVVWTLTPTATSGLQMTATSLFYSIKENND